MPSRSPQVPTDLYVIEDPAIDGIIVWQRADGSIWQTWPGGGPSRIATSLIQYLES